MALPIALGVAAGAMSLLGGIAGNKALTKQANANWNATLATLGQQRGVSQNELMDKAQDVNMAVGMELTKLGFEEKKAEGSAIANTTERNVYGATALKTVSQVEMDAALVAGDIVQRGEAAMKDVQKGLTNTMYQYNSGVYQASQNRANMLSQRKGGFELITGAVSTGLSVYGGLK